MLKLPSTKKGQVSFDFILAMLFLLLIFAFMGQNVLNMAKSFKDSETAERGHAILDSFENYAITAYSKDVTVNATFEPIGNLNYTISLSNKTIAVNTTTYIIFGPESGSNGDFVNITSDNIDNSVNTIPSNTVNISFGDFYVSKELQVSIQ
uniref:Class III signal peptide n=1 Tax=Methanococcus maripaludis (strain C6 / ATCC BAA-1332) TaxID=444158 RepID=A9A860_METM6